MNDEIKKTSFWTQLTEDDWSKTGDGWYCPALGIPGADVVDLSVNGEKQDSKKYEVDKDHNLVRWSSQDRPQKASLFIKLSDKLTTNKEKNRWKIIAIILPVVATIFGSILSYLAATRTLPNPIPDPNECPSSVPKIICSDTFKTVYSQWPNILAPLERYLGQPKFYYKNRDSTLKLVKIKNGKAIFQLDETSILENPYNHPITDEVKISGDPSQEVISFVVFDSARKTIDVNKQKSRTKDGVVIDMFTAEFKIPAQQTFTMKKTILLTKELIGEYAIVTNRPILGSYSMEFKIDPAIDANIKLNPWENGFKLNLKEPILDNKVKSTTRTMKGPLFSGHGFIPEWKITLRN